MADDRDRERRLTEIRARRGSAERLATIERLQEEAQRAERRSVNSSSRRTPSNSLTYFGHTWDEWFRMCDIGFEFIVSRARHGRTVTYSEVWEAVEREMGGDTGPPWRQLPNLLGYIAERSLETEGLIATAIVTYEGQDAGPGPGFFRLAAREGHLPKEDAPREGDPEFRMTQRQRSFWERHVDELFRRYTTS